MYCALQYKFYGPHIGVLYGKYELLDRLRAYKVRPAPGDPLEQALIHCSPHCGRF